MAPGGVVDSFHHDDAGGGLARGDERLVFGARDGIQELVHRGARAFGEICKGFFAVAAGNFLAAIIEVIIYDRGMAFGAADFKLDRIFDVHPTGGKGSENAALELE